MGHEFSVIFNVTAVAELAIFFNEKPVGAEIHIRDGMAVALVLLGGNHLLSRVLGKDKENYPQ